MNRKNNKILVLLMTISFLIFFIIIFSISISAQEWTEPVNISPNMPGLDNQPDLCIDINGTLHCVFTHKLDINWRKIYYSKSTDNGVTWTTPEDISLNEDTSLMNPHIVSDTNNTLYVAYDYNTGNPSQTMIYLITFDENQWSEPFIVSEGLSNSDHNQLVIDNNDRLYCFWYRGGESNYRYYEDEVWSEVIIPYPGDHYWLFTDIVVDDFNNLHCTGLYHDEGQTQEDNRVIYYKYEYDNSWSDKTFLSTKTAWWYGQEIDVDSQNRPHVAYRQKNPYSPGNNDDSTMYRFSNGIYWSVSELVINDPYGQCITVDPYNRVNIVDWEKKEIGFKIVHYQKIDELWQGSIIDETDFFLGLISFIRNSQKLFMAYYWSGEEGEGEIRFSSFDIITKIDEMEKAIIINNLGIYPNPFKTETTIEFKTDRAKYLTVSIYDLNGKHIKTLLDEYIELGKHKIKWNGKEVDPGIYLVRLQSGRKIITKRVEHIK